MRSALLTTRCVTIFFEQATLMLESIWFLSLVMLRYVDEALLGPGWKWLARVGTPIAAILIPAAFFLSVVSPDAREPNGLLNLGYIGAIFLAAACIDVESRLDSRCASEN